MADEQAKIIIRYEKDEASLREVQQTMEKTLDVKGVGREMQTGTSEASENVKRGFQQMQPGIRQRLSSMGRSAVRIVGNIGKAIGLVLGGVVASVYTLHKATKTGDEARVAQERLRVEIRKHFKDATDSQVEEMVKTMRDQEKGYVTANTISRQEMKKLQASILYTLTSTIDLTDKEFTTVMKVAQDALVGIHEAAEAGAIKFRPERLMSVIREQAWEDIFQIKGLEAVYGDFEALFEDTEDGFVRTMGVLRIIRDEFSEHQGLAGGVEGMGNALDEIGYIAEGMSMTLAEELAPKAREFAAVLAANKDEIVQFFTDMIEITAFIAEKLAPWAKKWAENVRVLTQWEGGAEDMPVAEKAVSGSLGLVAGISRGVEDWGVPGLSQYMGLRASVAEGLQDRLIERHSRRAVGAASGEHINEMVKALKEQQKDEMAKALKEQEKGHVTQTGVQNRTSRRLIITVDEQESRESTGQTGIQPTGY